MTESFVNAPLIELLAEVRWKTTTSSTDDTSMADESLVLEDASPDFYRRMAVGLGKLGFTLSERLVPAEYEVPDGSSTYRYLNPDDTETTVVYQVGDGIFSINGIPPYKTWTEFRPSVQAGLEVLMDSIEALGGEITFNQIDLNYIDAFGEEYLQGRSRYDLLASVLGFNLKLPDAIARTVDNGEPTTAFFHFGARLKNGDRIAVKTGFATVLNQPTIVLDTRVSHRDEVVADVDGMLQVLDRSHQVIHDTFVEMTEPIAAILNGNQDTI
jgi:uncharacterized protein (TIGR04255 family)